MDNPRKTIKKEITKKDIARQCAQSIIEHTLSIKVIHPINLDINPDIRMTELEELEELKNEAFEPFKESYTDN